MNERKPMRLKHPTIGLAYATRHVRYKSSKNSQSRKPNVIDRVRYTAAGGAGLDSYKSSKTPKSREPEVVDRVRYTAAGAAGLDGYKGSKIPKSREPDVIDRVRYNAAGGAVLDSVVRPPAVFAPAHARRRQLPPNYKSTARKLV